MGHGGPRPNLTPNPCRKCGCVPSRKVICTKRHDKRTNKTVYAKPGKVFCFFVCDCSNV